MNRKAAEKTLKLYGYSLQNIADLYLDSYKFLLVAYRKVLDTTGDRIAQLQGKGNVKAEQEFQVRREYVDDTVRFLLKKKNIEPTDDDLRNIYRLWVALGFSSGDRRKNGQGWATRGTKTLDDKDLRKKTGSQRKYQYVCYRMESVQILEYLRKRAMKDE